MSAAENKSPLDNNPKENPKTLTASYLSSVPCNTEVSIQIITPTQAIRVRSHLVGVDRQLCLILHRGNDAAWQSAKNYIREGQNLVIRLINTNESDARVVAFRSTIIKLDSVISRWLIVSFPQQIQAIKLRKYTRQALKLKASITLLESGKEISSGILNDISLSGCGYLGQKLSKQDEKQKLQICTQINEVEIGSIETQPEPLVIKIPITIKNSEGNDTDKVKMGLEFSNTEAERINAVQKILLQSLMD